MIEKKGKKAGGTCSLSGRFSVGLWLALWNSTQFIFLPLGDGRRYEKNANSLVE